MLDAEEERFKPSRAHHQRPWVTRHFMAGAELMDRSVPEVVDETLTRRLGVDLRPSA
jgi:hypothetical protein